jgi:hypothetical protein
MPSPSDNELAATSLLEALEHSHDVGARCLRSLVPNIEQEAVNNYFFPVSLAVRKMIKHGSGGIICSIELPKQLGIYAAGC